MTPKGDIVFININSVIRLAALFIIEVSYMEHKILVFIPLLGYLGPLLRSLLVFVVIVN